MFFEAIHPNRYAVPHSKKRQNNQPHSRSCVAFPRRISVRSSATYVASTSVLRFQLMLAWPRTRKCGASWQKLLTRLHFRCLCMLRGNWETLRCCSFFPCRFCAIAAMPKQSNFLSRVCETRCVECWKLLGRQWSTSLQSLTASAWASRRSIPGCGFKYLAVHPLILRSSHLTAKPNVRLLGLALFTQHLRHYAVSSISV